MHELIYFEYINITKLIGYLCIMSHTFITNGITCIVPIAFVNEAYR